MSRPGIWFVIASVRRTVLAIVVCSVLVSQLGMAANAKFVPDIRGTKCAKVGTSRTVGKVVFNCTKSGRSLVWRAAAARRGKVATTTTTTNAQAPRLTAAELVAAKITTHIEPMRSRDRLVPTIEYRFGSSVSDSDRTLTRQLAEAFFKYGSFPQLADYRNAISVSLSNSEVIETTAPWIDVSGWGRIAGAYTGTGTYSLVVQNFTAHRCGTGADSAAACAERGNGGDIGRYQVRVNVLHELSHGGKVALMGFDPTQGNRNLERMPMWLASGISNVQGAMLLAVIDNSTYVNPSISVSQAARCKDAPISLTSGSDTGGGWGCRGQGTGDFANEILVARFGLDKVLEFVAGSRVHPTKDTWSDWSSVWSSLFQRLFLQSPTSFERDVETYRDAVIAGTNLPNDFLDAKQRP